MCVCVCLSECGCLCLFKGSSALPPCWSRSLPLITDSQGFRFFCALFPSLPTCFAFDCGVPLSLSVILFLNSHPLGAQGTKANGGSFHGVFFTSGRSLHVRARVRVCVACIRVTSSFCMGMLSPSLSLDSPICALYVPPVPMLFCVVAVSALSQGRG